MTDGLPTGVTAVKDSGFTERWELKSNEATVSKDGEYNVYTYTKTYKVNVDPATVNTVEVGGVNYAPLNTPTKLTVQHNGSLVQIPFPIPAGKVTYSLTGFEKALVTKSDTLSFDTSGFTIPDTKDSTVTVGENGVTLLYKITVKGDKGAKFIVTDDGATLVSPKDDSITFNQEGSTFSGTVGDGGTTVFYVSKHFTQDNIETSSDTQTVSNTATIAHGDNAKGPDNDTATETTPAKEPDPQTYTVTYQWKEGTEVPEGAALPNDGNPIPVNVGETHDVADNPRSDVTKNKAGENGKWTCAWDQSGKVGSTATADSNIVITGTWTFTKDQPKTGNLIVKKVVSGDGVTLNDLPNIKITVAGTGTNSTYSRELTLATKDDESTSTTATWTIPDLAPGEYTVSESNADVKDYTYTTTYNNGTANSETVTVEKNKTITMTVTNTYTKNATVNLSQLIQKQLTLKDGSTLPDSTTSTTFTVTVKPEKVNDQTVEKPKSISGSVTVSALKNGTQNGDTYTAPFIFDNDGTLSLSAGTYTYTVQETEGDVSGVEYDSTIYQLKIEAKMDGTYSASYTVAPTGDAAGTTPTEVSTTKPLTIKNTYQAPDLTVEKKTVSVAGEPVNNNNPVAHVGEQIVWEVRVKNEKSTPARVTLTDAMAEGVYKDNECKTQADNVNWDADTHSWTATVSGEVTYYVNYTVKPEDIPKGKIVNTIVMNNGDEKKTANSDPVSTWDTKQLKTATKLNTSDWTTTVTLTLPTVNSKPGTQSDSTTAISKGSYVIDKIGEQFTFMDGLSLEKNNVKIPMQKKGDTYYFGENATEQSYLYKLTYTAQNGEEAAQFKWEINENIPAETTVTLSYKLKLTNPQTGTHGVKDLNGDGKVDDTGAAVDKTKALYTNQEAKLVPKDSDGNTGVEQTFPKPSVSYTVSSGNSGSHSGGSRPSLNTKDHYGYIIGYPVDYYTGQPTTDQTKKPVRPEGKITRAEVATIYFRMLTDESRTKFWSQSNSYSDVKAGDWFNNAVSTLSNAGIIAGYEDGSFRPNGYITRAEFATIAARFFDVTYNGKDLFPDISGHWAKDYINQAANKGFVNGYEDGTFKPDRNITRAEAVTLVNRTLDRHPDKNHFTKDMLVWPDNMDQTKWYYADMQEATNSHTYQMKENSDKTKYENWTKTLPIRNWEALEKAWSNANSSQGNGNVV